ncbi:MAG TPA: formate dehydrogenase accessory sulfurtransferase FdhD [Verrucomicrobiae bacterium]|nr:formate dehydrogenase accessory sulfurtransferase FdhD [Verrucomicrobiae bacterium]
MPKPRSEQRRRGRLREGTDVAVSEIWQSGKRAGAAKRKDFLAREEPLEIRVRGKSVAVTMRTPGHDAELAAGFLLSEGVIRERGDVVEIAPCATASAGDAENILNVFLAPAIELDLARLARHVFASSSCGICGKASIDAVHQHFAPVESNLKVSRKTIANLPEQMHRKQKLFAKTGGAHAAAIFDMRGKMIVIREDVGRHNAVDKVLGHCFLRGSLPLEKHLLLVSGRASFEIMQKALAARVAIICAVSAPSSLAVEFAEESQQTLIGFLRDGEMNIYTNPNRIEG